MATQPNDASSQATAPEDALERARHAARILYRNDQAAQHLGIRILEVAPGQSRLAMRVGKEMVNGHAICHGGLIFTLADTAFAYACNSHGNNTLAAAASIDFLAPGRLDDELTAAGREIWRAGRAGIYEVEVTNQRGERIALFRGRSHQIAGSVFELPQ